MSDTGKSIQKTLRLPKDLVDRIESLPERDGEDFAGKAKKLLRIGLDRLAWEKSVIREAEQKKSLRVAENPPDYGKSNGTEG